MRSLFLSWMVVLSTAGILFPARAAMPGPPQIDRGSECLIDGAVRTDQGLLLNPVNRALQRVLDLGISRIGSFDLQSFLFEAQEVRVCRYLGGFLPAANGDRRRGERNTSIYFVEQKLVVLQRIGWSWIKTVDLLERTTLHETLGALGYIDDDYQLSTPLIHLSHLESKEALRYLKSPAAKAFTKNLRRRHNVSFKVAGGSTSTGGGGDSLSIEMKAALYDGARQWVPSWARYFRGRNICFGSANTGGPPAEEKLISDTEAIIQASSFESSNDPLNQEEAFNADRNGKRFRAHLAGIFEGGIIASQLGPEMINTFKRQTYLRFEVRILYMQNPHPCHGKGHVPGVEQIISDVSR